MATPSPSIEAARKSPPGETGRLPAGADPSGDQPEGEPTPEGKPGKDARPDHLPYGKPFWSGVARVVFFGCIRLAFAGFLFLTSVYCLLVWVPFSYFGFIRNPLLGWLPVFVRMHGLIYGALLAALAITLIPSLRRNETRRPAAGFLLVNASACLYSWHAHSLSALQTDLESYFWSMLSLLPVAWLAALDLANRQPATALPEEREEIPDAIPNQRDSQIDVIPNRAQSGVRNLHWAAFAPGLAATLVAIAFAATSLLRAATSGSPVPAKLAFEGFALSLCFHLTIFVPIALIFGLIAWVTEKITGQKTPGQDLPGNASKSREAETARAVMLRLVLRRAFAALLIFHVLRSMILPTISFGGMQASIFSAVVSIVAVLFATGFSASLRATVANARIRSMQISPAWLWSALTLALLAAAYAIPAVLGRTDWDFAVQKSAVMMLWLGVLLAACRLCAGFNKKNILIIVYAMLAIAGAGFVCCARSALYNPDPAPDWQALLDNYAGADISFKTAYAALSRPVDDKAYLQFYEFLRQHTNLPRSASVGPADVHLVDQLQPTPGIKPNIFFFVIDSLRQDYIAAYNPAADYAPQIEEFARNSVVLKNAFTRYGGTALSEPAIWVGAMQLHKQYIEPFYPMNNLQKLLDTDGYHSYISVDPILRTILQPSSSITELDHDSKAWGDLDFVPTLKELQAKIDARADRNQPIFAYTQPQNVHTLTIERSKIKGGRKAVSISELHRMDAAFGEFLAFLRRRGLYDNSIIILTSDHGDCYGEFGRWGHSDFLFPQIIRIPLIIHLPPQMQQQFVWDASDVAFNTDITPSLFYLLGHHPTRNNELFGRPLFTQTHEEASAYGRPQYLLVSSYAPVYATLSGDARSLFIVDAVNSKNYYFDLVKDPTGSQSHVTIPIQKENEALIRHEVGLIDDLYNWHPADAGR
jgi:hypothetical protein